MTTTPQDLEEKFWKALASDRTVMLGLKDGAHPRPMTAMMDDMHEGVWFFTGKDSRLVQALSGDALALLTLASKGHDIFACVDGMLEQSHDRAVIDSLWNPFIAAWYPGGKDDPQLALLRFMPGHAEIWENESSLLAGIKILLGVDPRKDYADKVAEVSLN